MNAVAISLLLGASACGDDTSSSSGAGGGASSSAGGSTGSQDDPWGLATCDKMGAIDCVSCCFAWFGLGNDFRNCEMMGGSEESCEAEALARCAENAECTARLACEAECPASCIGCTDLFRIDIADTPFDYYAVTPPCEGAVEANEVYVACACGLNGCQTECSNTSLCGGGSNGCIECCSECNETVCAESLADCQAIAGGDLP